MAQGKLRKDVVYRMLTAFEGIQLQVAAGPDAVKPQFETDCGQMRTGRLNG